MLKPARPWDEEFLDRLRAIAPDCCPVTAYGALLPQAALDIPAHGWVNLHFSLLPAWRGAAPVQHAILHGDDMTGATTFRIVKELDAGPVYGVLTEPVLPAGHRRGPARPAGRAGAGLLVATMDGIESGELDARPQPAEGVSLAPKMTSADAQVRWERPPLAVDRRIRACTPAPGAWTMLARPDQALAAGRATGQRPRPPAVGVGRRWRPGSCGCSGRRAGRHGTRRWSWATSSHRASGGCPPPTGPAGCADGRGAGLRWRPGVGRAAAASSVASSRPVVTSAVAAARPAAGASSAAASSAAAVRRVAARSRAAGRGAPTQPAAPPTTC